MAGLCPSRAAADEDPPHERCSEDTGHNLEEYPPHGSSNKQSS